MYTVYVLEDDTGKRYKGMTGDLTQRLKDHAQGRTRTTGRMGKLAVIYQELHATVAVARKREKYLKSAAGRRFLKKILTKH